MTHTLISNLKDLRGSSLSIDKVCVWISLTQEIALIQEILKVRAKQNKTKKKKVAAWAAETKSVSDCSLLEDPFTQHAD